MVSKKSRTVVREQKHRRLRNRFSGTAARPRLAVGTVVAKRALEKGIKTVVYDRGGFIYAGKIKALAEAAREAGLEF